MEKILAAPDQIKKKNFTKAKVVWIYGSRLKKEKHYKFSKGNGEILGGRNHTL